MDPKTETVWLFEGPRAQAGHFLAKPKRRTYYTYVLCRPNGDPFYAQLRCHTNTHRPE
jgi:hypothetical protein